MRSLTSEAAITALFAASISDALDEDQRQALGHLINNPLTAIIGNLEFLECTTHGEQQRAALEALSEARRIAKIIREIKGE